MLDWMNAITKMFECWDVKRFSQKCWWKKEEKYLEISTSHKFIWKVSHFCWWIALLFCKHIDINQSFHYLRFGDVLYIPNSKFAICVMLILVMNFGFDKIHCQHHEIPLSLWSKLNHSNLHFYLVIFQWKCD